MSNQPQNFAPKVLVYTKHALPLSATFIRGQMLHLSEWKSVLVCRSIDNNGLDLSALKLRLLNNHSSILSRVLRRIRRTMKWASKSDLRVLREENGQVMHVHFGTEAVEVWPLARALGIPMLVTLHGYDINIYKEWWEGGCGGGSMKDYPSCLLQLSKNPGVQFIAVSKAIKKRAIEYGIPVEKIHVRYIGVDTSKFSPGPKPIEERKNILFVGRLVEKKGCKYLLEAFLSIQDSFPEHSLFIVGTGPLESELREFARSSNIRAKFFGAQTNSEVKAIMDGSQVFCMPSITAANGDAEGLPIVILEAQASGIPVITSARGGADEGIVSGKTGFSHAEKDIHAIQKLLAKLLLDEELLKAFSAAARINIKKEMDARSCARDLEAIYHKVLDECFWE